MIEFLKETGISDETNKKLYDENTNDTLIALECNSEECIKIIDLFKKLGIKNIEEILLNETYIFFKLYNEIIYKISKYNIDELVNAINQDYTILESII